MKDLRHKKVGKLHTVILRGNDLIITKYNNQTSQYDIIFERDYKTPRPDLYSNLNSVKKLKEFIKEYK